jgi:hypothetical protein
MVNHIIFIITERERERERESSSNLSSGFVKVLSLKKFTQHSFKILRCVPDVLLRVLSTLNHRPVTHKKPREEEKMPIY